MSIPTLSAAALLLCLAPPSFARADDEALPPRPVVPQDLQRLSAPAGIKEDLVDTAFLGVFAVPILLEDADALGLARGTGLQVTLVAPGSPAAKAGLREGDILAKLDDQLLVNREQFRVLVSLHKAGDTVALELVRNKEKPQKINAQLASRKLPEIGPGGCEQHRFTVIEQVPVEPELDQATIALMQKLREVQPKPGKEREGRPPQKAEEPQAFKGIHVAGITSRSLADETGSIHATRVAGKTTLQVEDKDGKSLYDGPAPADDKAWEKIPKDFRDKARKMVESMRPTGRTEAQDEEQAKHL